MPAELLISSTAQSPFRVRPTDIQEIDLKTSRIRINGSWVAVSPADIPNLQEGMTRTGQTQLGGPISGINNRGISPLLNDPGAARDDLSLPQEVGLIVEGKPIASLSKDELDQLMDKLGQDGIDNLKAKDSGFGLLVLEREEEFIGAFLPVEDKPQKDWAGANYYIARALIDNGRILDGADVAQIKADATELNKKQQDNPEVCPKDEDGNPGEPQSVHAIALTKLPKAGRSVVENKAVLFERVTALLNEAYQANPEDRADILAKAKGAITQNPADKSLHLAAHLKKEAQACIERGDNASPEADELLKTSQALESVQKTYGVFPRRDRDVQYSL